MVSSGVWSVHLASVFRCHLERRGPWNLEEEPTLRRAKLSQGGGCNSDFQVTALNAQRFLPPAHPWCKERVAQPKKAEFPAALPPSPSAFLPQGITLHFDLRNSLGLITTSLSNGFFPNISTSPPLKNGFNNGLKGVGLS